MKNQPIRYEIAVKFKDKSYSGSYYVLDKKITVSAGMETKSMALLGSSNFETLARRLLLEMIKNGAFEES